MAMSPVSSVISHAAASAAMAREATRISKEASRSLFMDVPGALAHLDATFQRVGQCVSSGVGARRCTYRTQLFDIAYEIVDRPGSFGTIYITSRGRRREWVSLSRNPRTIVVFSNTFSDDIVRAVRRGVPWWRLARSGRRW